MRRVRQVMNAARRNRGAQEMEEVRKRTNLDAMKDPAFSTKSQTTIIRVLAQRGAQKDCRAVSRAMWFFRNPFESRLSEPSRPLVENWVILCFVKRPGPACFFSSFPFAGLPIR